MEMVWYFVWSGIEISWRVIFTSYKRVDFIVVITIFCQLLLPSPCKPSHLNQNHLIFQICYQSRFISQPIVFFDQHVQRCLLLFQNESIGFEQWSVSVYDILQTNAWVTFIFLLADSLMYGSVCLSVCLSTCHSLVLSGRTKSLQSAEFANYFHFTTKLPKTDLPIRGVCSAGVLGWGGGDSRGLSLLSEGPGKAYVT